MKYLDILKESFNKRVSISEKRPGIFQIHAPLFHDDGDMMDIFISASEDNGKIRVSDYGMTLMRLSYSYDLDTDYKQRIFQRIVAENFAQEQEGIIYIDTKPAEIFIAVMQLSQVVAKVSNMKTYRHEVIKNMFYEMLGDFVLDSLPIFNPHRDISPIPERPELNVDFALSKTAETKPIYLFGVKDSSKARLVAVACLEFQIRNIAYTSVIVHEDFSSLSKKDQRIITNAADKQFYGFEDFKVQGEKYLSHLNN